MKTQILGVVVVLAAAAGAQAGYVSSTFDTDADGWTVRDFTTSAPYNLATSSQATVTWGAGLGNGSAGIQRSDPSNGTFFFQAPSQFLGNQADAFGQRLEFDLKTNLSINWTEDSLVVLTGAGLSLVAPISLPDQNVWMFYSLLLEPASFRYNTASGAVVSAGDLQAVLADLTGLYIPGEFHTPVEETSALDNVTLIPEPASMSLLALAAGVLMVRRSARV